MSDRTCIEAADELVRFLEGCDIEEVLRQFFKTPQHRRAAQLIAAYLEARGDSTMNEGQLQVGDTVEHITGGPPMVVEDVLMNGDPVCTCWDGVERRLEQRRFHPASLRKVARK